MDDQLRRQALGPPAARSTLLTLLGEFVAPYGKRVDRGALVAGLEAVGHRNGAARQAVSRSVSGGWLHPVTPGGRSVLEIAPDIFEMLRTGYPRIFGFGDPWVWDGRWHLLVIRVSERHREHRDRMRTQLEWAGFGSLGGGLWISPKRESVDEARRAIAASAKVDALGFEGEQTPGIGDSTRIVEQAWDLPALAARYQEFIETYRSAVASSDAERFVMQTSIVHAWRKFPFLDPGFPDELLPDEWPRHEARDIFRARHTLWRVGAESFFADLGRRSGRC